jgi:hypothetical protein
LGSEAETDTAKVKGWWKQRKDFMPAISSAALARVQKGDFDPLALASEILKALDSRAIQIWTDKPGASATLAALGWDGSLQPQDGADFVALVDTNMGYNKVDAVLERSLAHSVTWPDGPDASGLATTTITYTHPLTVSGTVCDDKPSYGENYADMTRRCYFDYVRLYVPGGSELVGVEGVEPDSASSEPGERGTQTLAGYLVVPPGSTKTVTFTYTLPSVITPDQYALVVQRQSGTDPLPLVLEVGGERRATMLENGVYGWPHD